MLQSTRIVYTYPPMSGARHLRVSVPTQRRGDPVSSTTKRPVFLNLLAIRLPAPGVMSIGHRVSGVALVVATPFLAHLLALSLRGPEGFAAAAAALDTGPARAAVVLLAWGLLHHLFAGVRYLLLDLDLGVELATARATAWIVLIGAPLAALGLVGLLP
jgi:succinate dehydrogenase / fumarate reductase cytochrome b subunit